MLNYSAKQQRICCHLYDCVFVPPEENMPFIFVLFFPFHQFSAPASPLFFTPISQDLSAHYASFAHQSTLKHLEMLF